MKPDPFYTGDVCHPFNEFGNLLPVVKVDAVECEFLGYNLEFVYTIGHHTLYLVEDFLHRAAYVRTCDERYGAVGTFTVAAFADFDVGKVSGGMEGGVGERAGHASRGRNVACSLFGFKVGHHLFPVELAVETVHFRDFFLQFLPVAF